MTLDLFAELLDRKQSVLDQLRKNRDVSDKIVGILGDDEARKIIETHLQQQ